MENAKELIIQELVKRGYYPLGKNKQWIIANSKVNYLTEEQSKAFFEIEKTDEYKDLINKDQASKLLLEQIPEILEWAKNEPINLVDLGCGNGELALEIAKKLNGKIEFIYCPIDTSKYMVKKASELFKKNNFKVLQGEFSISDLSNIKRIRGTLNRKAHKKNLFLLIGDTINNFEIMELLQSMRQGMLEKDLLIIEGALYNKAIEDKIKKCKKTKFMNNFLIKTLEMLGFSEDELEYGIRFKNKRIEFYYKILKEKTVENSEKIKFQPGDEIIAFVSYRTRRRNFLSYLNMYFSYAQPTYPKDKGSIVAICKK